MAITDNPADALQAQFENEQRSSDPVLNHLLQFASDINLPWAGSMASWMNRNRIKRVELLIDAIREELRRHSKEIQELKRKTQKDAEEFLALVLDGASK